MARARSLFDHTTVSAAVVTRELQRLAAAGPDQALSMRRFSAVKRAREWPTVDYCAAADSSAFGKTLPVDGSLRQNLRSLGDSVPAK